MQIKKKWKCLKNNLMEIWTKANFSFVAHVASEKN